MSDELRDRAHVLARELYDLHCEPHYLGGYQTDSEITVFQHGMQTACNAAGARLAAAERERDEARAADWLGMYKPQPNFGDDGTHTWADVIAEFLRLDALSDAQSLYLALCERAGVLISAERERDELRAKLTEAEKRITAGLAACDEYFGEGAGWPVRAALTGDKSGGES